MVQWFFWILLYDFAVVKLSLGEVTLAVRLLHYKNRNGLTYENRPCDTRLENDINRDGRCDTAFLFCLVRLPFQNPHNCTLGDHFTGFVGADEIYFVNIEKQQQSSGLTVAKKKQRSSFVSIWIQPTIYFRFQYPKTGIGLIVEVFDIDDIHNQTIHDSIDFYGRTLLDLKLDRSVESSQSQRIYLRSLFGTYTNLTADFSLYCSPNYYGPECETYCVPSSERYACDPQTGQKLCKNGYFGHDCSNDFRGCEDQPCWNNGTCVVYLRSYLCQCQKGFTGRSCETSSIIKLEHRSCNRTNCLHGDCSIHGQCICHNGWSGDDCNQHLNQRQSACVSHPCLHNSTCESLLHIDPLSAYRCHCPIGYTGRNCEVAIVTACERTPCVHGQCLKIDLYTEICICEENWSGIDCSKALPTRAVLPSITSSELSFAAQSTSTRSTFFSPVKSIQTHSSTKSSRYFITTTSKANLYDYLNWLNSNAESNPFSSSITTESSTSFQPYSPCLSDPCLHNSTCVTKSSQSFKCVCSPSFIGVYCEIEILHIERFQKNPCENSPCQHQSVCITVSNQQVKCVCRPHYTGKYCENPPPFYSRPVNKQCTRICQNGGSCMIHQTQNEQCICHDNYTGSFCELPKNNCTNSSCHPDPCTSNPCLYNGTCHRTMESSTNYTCSCLESYTGERCQSIATGDISSSFSRDLTNDDPINSGTELWPLAIIFGYVFSLMLVFIIIWFLWYGLSMRSRSSYRADIPYGDHSQDYFQPYRLGVSNPLFFSHQEHYPTQILKTFSQSLPT